MIKKCPTSLICIGLQGITLVTAYLLESAYEYSDMLDEVYIPSNSSNSIK